MKVAACSSTSNKFCKIKKIKFFPISILPPHHRLRLLHRRRDLRRPRLRSTLPLKDRRFNHLEAILPLPSTKFHLLSCFNAFSPIFCPKKTLSCKSGSTNQKRVPLLLRLQPLQQRKTLHLQHLNQLPISIMEMR